MAANSVFTPQFRLSIVERVLKGQSVGGCAPAELTSASPVTHSLSLYDATVHQTAADGNLSPFPLSHQKGALQSSW
jgi:hypothetical protein